MNILWFSTRGSAVVSLILLTAVVVLGILSARGGRAERWPAVITVELHRSLSLLSLVFLAIHVVTAIIDPFTSLGLQAALVPFAVDYRRVYLGLGSVALYLLVALIVTSLLRDRFGYRAWRVIHWAAYAFWPIALVHGIGTGTDAATPWLIGVEVAAGAAVLIALAIRLIAAFDRPALLALVPERYRLDHMRFLNPAATPGGPRLEAGTHSRGAAPGSDRLLAGPPAAAGPERLHDHLERLGPLPRANDDTIAAITAAGLLGRGGAGFPVGRKWQTVADRSDGRAVILANGAEGKPDSRKDRALMAMRPHLVIDGALIAAEAVGADEVVLFIGIEHEPALAAMANAIEERRRTSPIPMRLVEAPLGYVVGESSAAVHYVNTGEGLPTMAPPRMSEAGVNGRPTVVQNVESLAHAALIARYGPDWYRSAGRGTTRGTALVTVSGTTPAQRVVEIEYGTPLGEVLERVGGWATAGQGVMLGDSFGAWEDIKSAHDLPLDPAEMARHGLRFGAGVIAVVPEGTCGVVQTAHVMAFMAGESAGQCGPCVYGLRSLADACRRLAVRKADRHDLARLVQWGADLSGRGACSHPDGAMAFLASGVRVFAEEFELHARGRCSVATATAAL